MPTLRDDHDDDAGADYHDTGAHYHDTGTHYDARRRHVDIHDIDFDQWPDLIHHDHDSREPGDDVHDFDHARPSGNDHDFDHGAGDYHDDDPMTQSRNLMRRHPRIPSFVVFSALMCALSLHGPSASHAGINRWTSTGPKVPAIQAVAIDPTNRQVVYVGTAGAGSVFKSTDGGIHWLVAAQQGPGRFVDQDVKALLADSANPQIVYAGTNGTGVHKSSDGGAHWSPSSDGLTNLFVNALAADPSTSTTVYAATSDGVFRTTNGGTSWNPIVTGLTDHSVFSLAAHPTNPLILYAGTTSTVFKTANGGGIWAPVSNGLPAFTIIHSIAISRTDPATVYVGTDGDGVFKTTNGGSNWEPVNGGLPGPPRFVLHLAVDPFDADVAYAGLSGDTVYKTTNAGTTWMAVEESLPLGDTSLLQIDPANRQTIYAGIGGAGLFKSITGGTRWTTVNAGFADDGKFNDWAIIVDSSAPDTLYAGARNGGVFKSTDGAGSWLESGLSGVPVNDIDLDPANSQIVYAATRGSGVQKSIDGGGSWNPKNTGLGDLRVNALAIDPTNTQTIYAGLDGKGVYRTTNGADNWSPRNGGMPFGLVVDHVAVAPSNALTLYASSGGGLFRSTNGGQSWGQVTSSGMNFISTIVVDPSDAQVVYLSGTTVVKTINGGAQWTPRGNGLSGEPFGLVLDPTDKNVMYAGTENLNAGPSGVYKTTDGGQSWHLMDTGIQPFMRRFEVGVRSLAIDPSGAIVYAGSVGIFDYAIAPSKLGVFRSANVRLYEDYTGDTLFNGCTLDVCKGPFGLPTDLPLSGDWYGTGLTTFGVFRPDSRRWYIDDGNGVFDTCAVDICSGRYGIAGDLPVLGDWTGLGRATIGVYRPSNSRWYLDNGNGFWEGCKIDTCFGPFGITGDLPVTGDWAGLGKTAIGVFRPGAARAYLDFNANGTWDGCAVDKCVFQLGASTDLPLAGDWTGMGTATFGVYRPKTGRWYIDDGDGQWEGCVLDTCVGPFGGAPSDRPLVGAW